MGKAQVTVTPQINTTTPAMGFPPGLGVARQCSVGFTRESCCFFWIFRYVSFLSDKTADSSAAVIPAQAGIQTLKGRCNF
ncbi:hypothetical protein [Neisseria sicca]|uniref:hypothetical protein n=1 Tax=Neisseria sicca TaxID=490 RepID=UPI0011456931|nr:hypothetical protein [Neisseria sicca]